MRRVLFILYGQKPKGGDIYFGHPISALTPLALSLFARTVQVNKFLFGGGIGLIIMICLRLNFNAQTEGETNKSTWKSQVNWCVVSGIISERTFQHIHWQRKKDDGPEPLRSGILICSLKPREGKRVFCVIYTSSRISRMSVRWLFRVQSLRCKPNVHSTVPTPPFLFLYFIPFRSTLQNILRVRLLALSFHPSIVEMEWKRESKAKNVWINMYECEYVSA